MSVLYYILIIIGSIVGGFVIAFLFFFMITYFIDWKIKRKQKKLDQKKDMLKPEKDERGLINQEDDRTNEQLNLEYREFEKLRDIGKRERGVTAKTSLNTNVRGIQGRSEMANKPIDLNSPIGRKDERDSGEFKIY